MSNSFSLLEVMIVVALLMILMGLGICSQPTTSILVRTDIQTIAAVVMYMQRVAANSMQPHEISFDIDNRSYTYNGVTQYLSPGVEFAVLNDVKGPPASPVENLKNPITFDGHRIHFNSKGVCTSGSLYMCDKDRSCLYALTLPIGYTAYPHIYYFDQKWSEL